MVPLRNTGAAISPTNAFLILQGINTLGLRMERTCDNSLAVARHLQQHPNVAWVKYAGLPDHPGHALAQKYMGGKASGILSFSVRSKPRDDPVVAGARALDALKRFTRLVNIGDTKSLATHPASTTHRPLDPVELAAAGVGEDMLRLSIGVEHIDDLLADLDQALVAAWEPGSKLALQRSRGPGVSSLEAAIRRPVISPSSGAASARRGESA